MEQYCVKNEMDKQWSEENYLEIAERQDERISQRDVEYTDFLCWILEQANWDHDLTIIKQEEWDRFYNSNNEEDEMKMNIVDSSQFYEKFKEISSVDILKNEDCFVSTKYIQGNSVNLIVNVNEKNERYVIDIV